MISRVRENTRILTWISQKIPPGNGGILRKSKRKVRMGDGKNSDCFCDTFSYYIDALRSWWRLERYYFPPIYFILMRLCLLVLHSAQKSRASPHFLPPFELWRSSYLSPSGEHDLYSRSLSDAKVIKKPLERVFFIRRDISTDLCYLINTSIISELGENQKEKWGWEMGDFLLKKS